MEALFFTSQTVVCDFAAGGKTAKNNAGRLCGQGVNMCRGGIWQGLFKMFVEVCAELVLEK